MVTINEMLDKAYYCYTLKFLKEESEYHLNKCVEELEHADVHLKLSRTYQDAYLTLIHSLEKIKGSAYIRDLEAYADSLGVNTYQEAVDYVFRIEVGNNE